MIILLGFKNVETLFFKLVQTKIAVLFLISIAIDPAQADWAKNFGAQSGASVYGMSSAVDSSGNVYSAGDFDSATLTIGGVTLTRIGEKDAYVVKFDSSGNVLWAKNFGGSGAYTGSRDVAVDGSGNVYLTGSFTTANLTTPALTVIGSYGDGFAIKLNSSGTTTWAKNFGGVGASTSLYSIAVDGSGNVYVSGNFSGDNITTPALTRITGSSGLGDAFVVKLSSSGTITWAKNFGGTYGSSYAWAVAVDSIGNVYVSGNFTWDMTTPSLTLYGSEDVFAIKLNSSGTIVWGKNFGGTGSSTSSFGIAVDIIGNVYVSGYFSNGDLTNPALTKISDFGDAFAIKLDSGGTTTWAKNFGGNGGNIGVSANTITVDSTGNVYLVGSYSGGNLTTPALTSIAGSDIYVLKLNSSGTTTWAKSFGGVGASPDGHGLAVDGSGNVYVSGEFGYASLTTPALTHIGGYDALVMKLNSSGVVTWAKNYGGFGKGDLFLTGMTKDTAGNIYLAGITSSAIVNFGAYTLNLIGSQDAFVAKLNPTGTVVWAKNFGGASAYVQSSNVAVDGSGNVYLGAYFNGSNLTTPALTLIGNYDALAIKLDSSGNTTWSKNFGGSGAYAYGQSIAVDGSGNVYLSGDFNGGALTTPALTLIGLQDSFAIKLNSGGTITWSKKFGGSGAFAYNKSVAVDSSGNVYLGGYFESSNLTTPALTLAGYQDAYAIKLNSSGTTTWSKRFGGSGASTYGQSIAVDASGNVYLAGQFTGLDLTTPVLTLIGATDAFAIKLNSSGTTTWAKNFGGSGASVFGRGIAVDSGGNVYLGGDFLSANMTTPALTALGGQDAFILKLNSSGTTTFANGFGGSGANAEVRGFSADGTGNILIAGSFSFSNLTTPALNLIGNTDGYVIDVQLFNIACTVAGKIKYDSTNGIMVFCDGSFWQSMNSNTAATCTGTTAGKFQYYSNGASSDIVWYGSSCRSAKTTTTYGACVDNGKIEWNLSNTTVRGCINGTWTSLKGW